MSATDELLARAAAFARDVVMPGAPRWEAGQRIGREAVEAAAAAAIGLTGLEVPTAWGGLGLGFCIKAQVAELLGAADFGFTMSLINTHNVAAKLAREAAPEIAALCAGAAGGPAPGLQGADRSWSRLGFRRHLHAGHAHAAGLAH